MVKIISAPNAVLLKKTKIVSRMDSSVLNTIEQMKEALLAADDPEGVGLAAPQIGKSLSIFIAKPYPKSPISVFINPKIIAGGPADSTLIATSTKEAASVKTELRTKQKEQKKLEGCLSLPNIWGQVKRKPEVILSYLDEAGKSHTRHFKGFMATIIQHETDHLNGALFTKHVLEQKGTLYKSYKDREGEIVFEEMEI